ncbi:MAG TPA: hypothetical protein PL041_07285 [Melioribacteraceae bacterium]|nr:hypothetical protein [Melioribacteraceae bacterium]
MPRLGKDLTKNKIISKEKIDLLIDILLHYKEICNKNDCKLILPFATQAMRSAANSSKIIEHVYNKTGLKIEIISGNLEAKLSYYGSISNVLKNDYYIVIDIGGGSTEIIYGNKDEILFAKSYKIGVVSLTEEFLQDSYNYKNLIATEEYINYSFDIPIKANNNTSIIAVAGTPTSLSCMLQNIKNYKDEYVENKIITIDDLNSIINKLIMLTPKKILFEFGEVLKGREDLILSGALILKNVLAKLNSSNTIVSTRGLRYGIIQNYLTNAKREKQE